MGELNFYCGVMGVGKTATLIEQAKASDADLAVFVYSTTPKCYLLESRNGEVLASDPLDSEGYDLKSCLAPHPFFGHLCYHEYDEGNDCLVNERYQDVEVFIDEIQFASESCIKNLRSIAYDIKGNINCYGLVSDYRGELFPAAGLLLRLADNIYKLDRECEICDNYKAVMNMRCTSSEELIDLNKENYLAVCYKCFEEKDD